MNKKIIGWLNTEYVFSLKYTYILYEQNNLSKYK